MSATAYRIIGFRKDAEEKNAICRRQKEDRRGTAQALGGSKVCEEAREQEKAIKEGCPLGRGEEDSTKRAQGT